MKTQDRNWPDITRTMQPWTRWWWLGSAVDPANITRLLEEYRRAGIGGVEITPIYGVQGQEARDIPYLSPRWLEMLRHTLAEAARLGLGVDMVTGTGWPFGGPQVSDEDAEDKLVLEKTVGADGAARYDVSHTWAGRNVKRAAPGGEGKCINPFSGQSLRHYLARFDEALRDLPPGALRGHFHDSFEYLADWSPSLFDEFQVRRGYDLRDHLPALYGAGERDTVARVKTDYRETLADLLLENFTQSWTAWVNGQGSLSRNQAHGSPGNLLDLYGAADIPETEIFNSVGDPRISKFASSAAHVLGKPLASSESCTWLGEHFTVSLAQCKAALDRLLIAGINHVFYHGAAYSPSDAPWPGWLFYASTTFAPQDPLWRDFLTLNAYLARCQSLLQSGQPDNDVLLYWPLHDLWQKRPEAYMLEIGGQWLATEPVGRTAQRLWDEGIAFDYVSDRQLALAQATPDGVQMPGGLYRAILVPPCDFMPEETLKTLVTLAEAGVSVILEGPQPGDVPGLYNLAARRERFGAMREAAAEFFQTGPGLGEMLTAASVRREALAGHAGVQCLRRRAGEGHTHFFIHEGTEALDGWIELATPFQSAVWMDAMTGETGIAAVRHSEVQPSQVYVQLLPGASLFLRTFARTDATGPLWFYFQPAGEPVVLDGTWTVDFLAGGPALPPSFQTEALVSWTNGGNVEAARFAGTARYTLIFDAPHTQADEWRLDLGTILDSARVSLNGRPLGAVIAEPFQIALGALKPTGNVLEIEITNVAANRIRDLDRRGQPWKIFREINFVGKDYQPFDASDWPVREAGLLGPVRLLPMRRLNPGERA